MARRIRRRVIRPLRSVADPHRRRNRIEPSCWKTPRKIPKVRTLKLVCMMANLTTSEGGDVGSLARKFRPNKLEPDNRIRSFLVQRVKLHPLRKGRGRP